MVRSCITGIRNPINPVGRKGSIVKKLSEKLENYLSKIESKYYPLVENLLDLIYETYIESNPVAPITTVAGRAAKTKEKEFEAWLRETHGMDILVEDCVEGKIPLWEKIMVRQGSVC